ncbi:MAG: DUF2294 domain-containing protein [Patulibacter minatonensis]
MSISERPSEPLPASEQPAAISRYVAQLITAAIGRGPTRIRTRIAEDVIIVVMEELLTHAESSLAANDKGDLVIQVRRAFQEVARPDLVGAVEAITGRRVRGFLSDHQLDPDIAIETFILE